MWHKRLRTEHWKINRYDGKNISTYSAIFIIKVLFYTKKKKQRVWWVHSIYILLFDFHGRIIVFPWLIIDLFLFYSIVYVHNLLVVSHNIKHIYLYLHKRTKKKLIKIASKAQFVIKTARAKKWKIKRKI